MTAGRKNLPDSFRHPASDPRRKIRFREEAREIVAKDRNDRKYGRAVDTAGAIARALERAYRRGFEDAQSENPASIGQSGTGEGALDWVTIPPRPRNAFWTICLFILSKGEQQERGGHLAPAWTERGTPGWQLVVPSFSGREKPLGEKTISPLVRLGLLEFAKDPPERLLISDLGKATWRLFLDRGGQFPEDLSLA